MTRGWVRIIGGQWRGRKLKVPTLEGLRPTPDRVRETVFNWLMPILPGKYCLDAFTGSGAFGFEALSRGAAKVVMVDAAKNVVNELIEQAKILKTTQAEIYCANIPQGLKRPTTLFDVVFLDPPYQTNLLFPTCAFLEQENYLADEAYIYLEASDELTEQNLPPNWRIIKSKRAGQVAYHLVLRSLKN